MRVPSSWLGSAYSKNSLHFLQEQPSDLFSFSSTGTARSISSNDIWGPTVIVPPTHGLGTVIHCPPLVEVITIVPPVEEFPELFDVVIQVSYYGDLITYE